jgi:4-hydroxy-2-oxoglutarate aldolase
MLNLNGIFPPLPTGFNYDESLSTKSIPSNIEKLSKFNLAGFLVLGSNGELVHLSEKEKLSVYETARNAITKDKLMIAGTGGQSTIETIRLTKSAAEIGADAALVLNPFYYKGLMNKSALVRHFHKVAEASEIPVIIYNMPANSGLDMDAETILEIASHPNIIGLKDSGGNVTKMGTILANAKENFQVLAGSAGFLLPALSIGAVGGILALANIAPQQCIDIMNNFHQGNLRKAQLLQLSIIELNSAITRKWGVPALKFAMDYLGLYGGPGRKPLQTVDDKIKKEIIELINKSKLENFKEE